MSEIEKIDNSYEKALKYALKVISFQPKTKYQIVTKLKEKNFSDKVIDDIIKTLKRHDYVNDKKYALQWIREKIHAKPIGRMLAYKKLKEKGIENGVIKEIIDLEMPPEKELRIANALAIKKIKAEKEKCRHKDRRKLTQKIALFLASRGFSYDTIERIAENIKS